MRIGGRQILCLLSAFPALKLAAIRFNDTLSETLHTLVAFHRYRITNMIFVIEPRQPGANFSVLCECRSDSGR